MEIPFVSSPSTQPYICPRAQTHSLVRKHSVDLRGPKTSISLEDLFWSELRRLAEIKTRGKIGPLIVEIEHDMKPEQINLSSAIRLYVLAECIKERGGTAATAAITVTANDNGAPVE